jgi:1,4-alpha-glucan branching enzyme
MLYAFTENFLLPFSHDEVVHGKGSMLNKMPGDEWQRFANLRLLYTYMFTHPGKKLLFMGTEFGQGIEWNSAQTLDWYVLQYQFHQGLQQAVKDLNRIYHQSEALYQYEFEWQGFEWIDCHDAEQSILVYLRQSDKQLLVIAINFTPVPRHDYRIGVPKPGIYQEIFNSDAECYGGSNVGNGAVVLVAEEKPWMDRAYSMPITLPPLAGIILKPLEDEQTLSVSEVTEKPISEEVAEKPIVTEEKTVSSKEALDQSTSSKGVPKQTTVSPKPIVTENQKATSEPKSKLEKVALTNQPEMEETVEKRKTVTAKTGSKTAQAITDSARSKKAANRQK